MNNAFSTGRSLRVRTLLLIGFVCLSGCNEQRIPKVLPPGTMPITFVSFEEYLAEGRKCGTQKLGEHGKYETWERLHEGVIAVAEKYGNAGGSPDPVPDFYHTGDWFDELRDGFSLHSTKGLNAEALRDFQKVVAAHHPRASLQLVGQEKPIEGVEILISSAGIFVMWDGESAVRCQRKLERLKIYLE